MIFLKVNVSYITSQNIIYMKRCLKEKKNEWQLNEASQGSAKQLTIKCLSLYYLLHVGVFVLLCVE